LKIKTFDELALTNLLKIYANTSGIKFICIILIHLIFDCAVHCQMGHNLKLREVIKRVFIKL